MNSRERLLTALSHQEPDRIPFDLGSTQVTGIHVVAYRNLRAFMGLPVVEARLCDTSNNWPCPTTTCSMD
jgi:uroporphyrinogen decarboxylase